MDIVGDGECRERERERERGKKIVHGVEFGERKLGQRRRPGVSRRLWRGGQVWIGDDLTQHLMILDSERGRQMGKEVAKKLRADKDAIRITQIHSD